MAGCEAALAAADRGVEVLLYDMKPAQLSPAHSVATLAELVCSNSLRSDQLSSAVGLLKAEMELLGSHFMHAARSCQIPAGKALAVDRACFSDYLDQKVKSHPKITLSSQRWDQLPREGLCVLATGPLTTDELARDLAQLSGSEHLHFYDAIAPIVAADSVDPSRSFWQDRYSDQAGDYLNCPLTQEEFEAFYQALTTLEQVPLHDFEKPRFFEGCLPVEVMASRGLKTLLFGPMKPVGLTDPTTGRRPHAVLQLRKEDVEGRLLNLVGFQTKLTHASQLQVFRLIPALARAEFVRLGSIHRNTFLDAPRVLSPALTLLPAPHIMVAGQLSGVEGYVESAATGLLCGINAARLLRGLDPALPPPTSALGGLLTHLANTNTRDFQPSNINWGLLPPLPGRVPKKQRGQALSERALEDFKAWMGSHGQDLLL